MVVEEFCKEIGGGCCRASDEGGLDGAAERSGAYEPALDGPEDGEGEEGDGDGELKGGASVRDKHVREQGDEASRDIGEGYGEGGTVGTVGGRLFKAQLEAHHEADPRARVALEGFEDGGGRGAVDGVL